MRQRSGAAKRFSEKKMGSSLGESAQLLPEESSGSETIIAVLLGDDHTEVRTPSINKTDGIIGPLLPVWGPSPDKRASRYLGYQDATF